MLLAPMAWSGNTLISMGLKTEENVLSVLNAVCLPCGYEVDLYIPALNALVEVDG